MNSDLAAQRAMDRLGRVGFDSLSETDQVLATVWLFASGVENQGFARYYASHKGDLAFFVPSALRAISANKLAALAEEANSVFGPEGPPRDCKTRRVQVDALPEPIRARFLDLENRYFASEEDLDELLETYLMHHPVQR